MSDNSQNDTRNTGGTTGNAAPYARGGGYASSGELGSGSPDLPLYPGIKGNNDLLLANSEGTQARPESYRSGDPGSVGSLAPSAPSVQSVTSDRAPSDLGSRDSSGLVFVRSPHTFHALGWES